MKASAPKQETAQNDSQDLLRLGYAQELLRSMGGFSNFAISFSIISILTGAVTLFDYGLSMGGPLEMTLGWPIVSLGTMMVALSMAELCSALPTSGGMYHWSATLGGPTWAWFTAWFNIVGLVAAMAAIDYGCAQFLVPLLGLPSDWSTLFVVYALLLVSHGMINHFGIRWVAYLNDLSVTVHIVGVVALIGALLIFAPKQPLSFLLNSSTSSTIKAPYIWLFMLGMLQAQWTYTGYDASAHVAEETIDPRRRAPWGMVLAVLVSGLFGYLLILSLAWVIPNIPGVLNARDHAGNPLPAVLAIIETTLGQRAGIAVLGLTAAAMWFCGLSCLTSVSRTIYAFARDKGLPMSSLWSRVTPGHKVPSYAIWLSVALALAATVYSGIYSVVTSMSVVGFYISYIIPVYLGWRKKSQWRARRGPWHLGAWSNLINILGILWTVFICLMMVMPPNSRAGWGICATLTILFVLHRVSGKHEPPRALWDLASTVEESEAVTREQ